RKLGTDDPSGRRKLFIQVAEAVAAFFRDEDALAISAQIRDVLARCDRMGIGAGYERLLAEQYLAFALFYSGELVELRRRLATGVPRARLAGHRQMEAFYRLNFPLACLLDDAPDLAENDLRAARRDWDARNPGRPYGVIDIWAEQGLGFIALYS